MRKVSNLVEALYGGISYARVNYETNVANIAEAIIARANPARAAISITNNSVNNVYLHTTNEVSPLVGIILLPNATFILNYIDDDLEPTLEWHAAAAANNSRITIRERILQ